ncbi:MAG: hypothetical protein EOM08_04335 [Clostridia bacterium]|nr:hypothetical protein [Clostridia bacterium]NCC75646.1 hypothetical protein [Clostridia bacterium]
MSANQIFILIAIISLAFVAILFFFVRGKKQKRLSPLAAISFAVVLAGLLLFDNRIIGYSFIAIGIILSIIDAMKKGNQ